MPKINFNTYTVTFDNEEQSNLFLEFLEKTSITEMKHAGVTIVSNESLREHYLEKRDHNKFKLAGKYGDKSIISKFMEITGIVKMDYKKYMHSEYHPIKNLISFLLAEKGKHL